MTALGIARKLAEMKKTKEAQRAYTVFLQQEGEKEPQEELEAAGYIFFSKGEYKVAYSTFVSLYNRGLFQEEIWNIVVQGFYLPNESRLRRQYKANCQALAAYPYLFRQDFLDFDDLPLFFFPFDEKGFLPFFKAENRFGDYVDFGDPVIDQYFFQDLEKPVLAEDVYSQYQLEYLNDNVRKSEWVGRENHIYLHYTNWSLFCAHLQVLSFKRLLKEEKLVFLFEEEIEQYPIDFKERFGVDYSQYPVKPVGIREVNRLIWHTQLSSHNGGDFFNEIFYGHPNLLAYESVMFDNTQKAIHELKVMFQKGKLKPNIQRELSRFSNHTEKDFLVAYFLYGLNLQEKLDPTSRIAPVFFFQPHFPNILYELHTDENFGTAVLDSKEYREIQHSPLFQGFKYIKTMTPIRRFTTSYGATVRFMYQIASNPEDKKVMTDVFTQRLLNRSFMVDPQDRLYKDSIMVRFEDGKLNPRATFTALAEFLDIPYTESMTYCSGRTGLNPESMKGNDRGFDPAAVYRTYDEYVNDADRALLEYFMRDAYRTYGYDFKYYKGELIDEKALEEGLKCFTHLDQHIIESAINSTVSIKKDGVRLEGEEMQNYISITANEIVNNYKKNRFKIMKILLHSLRFINKNGQPLRMMKPLKLDPALLEQPLYR